MRTPQQAMKDAIDSGVVKAWIDGKAIQYNTTGYKDWSDWTSVIPPFAMTDVNWRVKPIPQKPTVADWRPISELSQGNMALLLKLKNGEIVSTSITSFLYYLPLAEYFAPLPE